MNVFKLVDNVFFFFWQVFENFIYKDLIFGGQFSFVLKIFSNDIDVNMFSSALEALISVDNGVDVVCAGWWESRVFFYRNR